MRRELGEVNSMAALKTLNKVAGYRVMMGLSQKEIGEKMGMTGAAYSNKELGKRAFNDTEKKKFKEILNEYIPGITIDEIFF